MSNITVTPLGAGQDVGRSCLLVCIGGKRVMLDCGMHMGYNDDRRFPDFTFVSGDEPLTDFLDAVIISHFHLDHCGALPYMTEMVGYNGPIYMTGPTLAIGIFNVHFSVSKLFEKLIFTLFSSSDITGRYATSGGRTQRRDQLFHLPNDQGLYEEGQSSQSASSHQSRR